MKRSMSTKRKMGPESMLGETNETKLSLKAYILTISLIKEKELKARKKVLNGFWSFSWTSAHRTTIYNFAVYSNYSIEQRNTYRWHNMPIISAIRVYLSWYAMFLTLSFSYASRLPIAFWTKQDNLYFFLNN